MSIESSAAVGPPPGMAVRLSSNESPFGPSPAAVEAMQAAVADAHRYPDDQSIDLRGALAAHEGRSPDEIAVGNGSANLLMDLIAHETGPGTSLLAYERAFIVYRLGARNVGADYVEVPTGDRYDRKVADLLDRIDDTTRLIIVDNPANPTGDHLTGDEVRELVAGVPDDVTVVLDEAYHHYASGQRGYQTVDTLGIEHPRLLVSRTFSKAFALPGARLGYLIGDPGIVRSVDAYRARFNLNVAAQAGGIAALADGDHLERTIRLTLESRERMVSRLRELGADVIDGLGNFVLLELGGPAAPVVEAFAEHGVGVRPLAPYGMLEQIRVTVGTPDETDAFLTAAEDVLG